MSDRTPKWTEKTPLLLLLPPLLLLPAAPATADTATTTPATPTPTIGTGGLVNGTNQGASCADRPPMRYTPAAGTNPYAWAQPDWPGLSTVTTPVPSTPSCSR